MEKITDIARSVLSQRELEIQKSLSNIAFGRFNTKFNGVQNIFWLTNRENTGQNRAVRDINGNVLSYELGPLSTSIISGKAVYKNTRVGEILILNQPGIHTVVAPGGLQTLEVLNGASYRPVNENGEFAVDLIITLNTEQKSHIFQSLTKILELSDTIVRDKEELLEKNIEEEKEILYRIAEKESELLEYLNRAHSFIRRSAELRYQPILDPIQERIKRSMVFEGVLIINGGPGTGKTTSVIQRIQFLISKSIEEYYNLSQSQKDVLYGKDNWLFYSPSELLALYLKSSMQSEGLKAEPGRVRVWSDDRNELIKAYKLVDTEKKRPFLIYNKHRDVSLFSNDSESIRTLISDFSKFFIAYLMQKLDKVLDLDVSKYSWSLTGISIQKFLSAKKNISSLEEIIRLYVNLNETYQVEAGRISNSYNDLVKRLLAGTIKDVKINAELVLELTALFKEWRSAVNPEVEDSGEDIDLIEIEEEDFEENTIEYTFDFELELFTKLKTLIRKLSLRLYDKTVKLNPKERALLEYFPNQISEARLSEIGELAFFKKHFDKILKGVISNVVRELPSIYKKYRLQISNSEGQIWNMEILEDLIKDRNIRLHVDEQSFLLYFVNNLCFLVNSKFSNSVNDKSHPYFLAYDANVKPVIAVDEASDFSLIDIIAMHSFGHPEIFSFTLSGDIMQRVTKHGLSSWDEIVKLIPKVEVHDLEVSYRQSQTLIELAKAIYFKSVGHEAPYRAFLEKDETEPTPLLFCSEDHLEKLTWLASRIIEIYRAYGNTIPSIAVFLPSENLLDSFARELGALDDLADVGIRVVACRDGIVLGDKNTIRIFSIDKIKGLEFEAVFFHDLDKLFTENISMDDLLKYIYVGLSRATFYLGVTANVRLPLEFSELANHFQTDEGDWRAIKRV